MNKILVKKETPSVVTVGLGWPAASRESNKSALSKDLDFGIAFSVLMYKYLFHKTVLFE